MHFSTGHKSDFHFFVFMYIVISVFKSLKIHKWDNKN